MACYHPLTATRVKLGTTGKSKLSFIKSGSPIPTNQEPLRIPCGQCIGCKLDRSRMWATRCMHETRSHDHNSFITLTYDDENLPPDGSLYLSHWQDFMKRLRHHAGKDGYHKLKFFHCGEYGDAENTQRPHYHALIFGYDPPDRKLFKMSNGHPVYNSDILDNIWQKGFTGVGDVTWHSAAYVARYALKKINGNERYKVDPKTGLTPYERVHPYTLETNEVLPEYATQSRNPGIGKKFFEKHTTDIYPWDECIVNGHPTKPPRYYDYLFEQSEPAVMEEIRTLRIKNMEKHLPDNTRKRLKAKEAVKKAATNQLIRDL